MDAIGLVIYFLYSYRNSRFGMKLKGIPLPDEV